MNPEGPRPGAREAAPGAPRPPPEPSAIVLALGGPIARADIPSLCERVRSLLGVGGAGAVDCDVGSLEPDAVTVDALARLQLTARRLGLRVRFKDAPPELRRLLCLMGLDEVLPCCGLSDLEPRGQPEEREQTRGVQEERDPGDATA
jgi:ABC-type transporter Mla MlaB component